MRTIRQQVAILENLAALEVVFQPVTHDQIRAEQHELLHVMRNTQPSDDRGDDSRLATTGYDVKQQPIRADLRLTKNLMRIDHPQEGLPLVRPERSRPR